MKKTRIKNHVVVGIILHGVESFATDKCRTKYNIGNPINVIKWHLN